MLLDMAVYNCLVVGRIYSVKEDAGKAPQLKKQ